MSRARCRARSRAPRSRATCCPTARSTWSIRSAHRWPRASWPDMAVELAADGPAGRRDRRGPRGAGAGHADLRRPRDARVPARRAAGSAAPRPRSARCCRSSRSSGSRTAWSRRSTGSAPARKARERLIELICERPSSGWRSSIRSAPTSRRSATRSWPRGPGSDAADVPIALVGPSVGPHLGPGLRRRGGPVSERSAGRSSGHADVAARLRRPCRPVPSGRRRNRDPRLYSGPECVARRSSTLGLSSPGGAPRGVVRETTRTDGGRRDRPTRRSSVP